MTRLVKTPAKVVIVVLVLCATVGAARAEADVLVTPFVGVTFGGATTEKQDSYGLSLAGMAAGVFGFELDIARTGRVFGDDATFSGGALTTGMANILVGLPIGPVRPYVVGGLGLIRSSVDSPGGAPSSAQSDLGVDVGAGVMGFFGDRVGARADVRYFRNVSGGDGSLLNFDLEDFNFWRATVGVTFRF
jgi:opacity protein-like surface antigen